MINQDKPAVGVPQTELNIGDGFNLLVGGTFRLVVGAVNALAGMTNIVRPSQGETWATVASTWATEDETWEEVSQLITNAVIAANIWESRTLPWTVATPWLLTGNGITNFDKP